jgi:enamine deaminase RidA (YjgF/YER057c/UK114 family)
LGAIGFASKAAGLPAPQDIPFAALDIPPLEGGPFYELWTTDEPVRYDRIGGARLATTESLLFGLIEVAEDAAVPLEETSRQLYEQLFGLLGASGYSHLLRVWNYFSGITAETGGMERYRRFTLGRHQAFQGHGRSVEAAPAACALGSGSGPLSLFFLAGKEPGHPLENPRQVSAYRYPAQYGPRSPTFSRALLSRVGGQSQLFISGTASIVGHESLHPDDPAAQTQEVLTNIRALLDEARAAGLATARRLLLKAYVRHPVMLEQIRPIILEQLGAEDRVVFLKAEICRPELLVEIEGAYL